MDRYHEKLGRARAALFWVALAIIGVAWVIARLAPASLGFRPAGVRAAARACRSRQTPPLIG